MNKPRKLDKSDASEIEDPDYKSKTQLKQEADELKKLGMSLVDLSKPQLSDIPLDDEIRQAVVLAGKINRKKDGFRRQLQLIGKMLRNREVEPILFALEKLKAPHIASNQRFHQLETLRDQILSQGDSAIQQAVEKYPNLDRQKLRQLHRQAVKQKEAEKSPIAAREIFQYLKLTIDE